MKSNKAIFFIVCGTVPYKGSIFRDILSNRAERGKDIKKLETVSHFYHIFVYPFAR